MNSLRTLLLISFSFFTFIGFTQIPAGYYDAAAGLTGQALKIKLHDIISNGYNSVSYADLWTSYQTTDIRTDYKVWDMYSDIPGGTAPYLFTFVTDQCGSYNGEGNCYNREHSVPESWFNGASPMYSDLFHVVPTDGWVNNKRSNYPFGDIASVSWTSLNGSKLGTSAVAGYTGTVFEPIDSFKGDFARIYFYMATRYKDEIPSWSGEPFSSSDLTTWAKNMFLQWNALDTVSAKEKIRNNKVYNIQNNRNPYVDHPEWINAIWGTTGIDNNEFTVLFNIFPNPASNYLNIQLTNSQNAFRQITINLMQMDGKIIFSKIMDTNKIQIDVSDIPDGIYFLTIKNQEFVKTEKITILK